MQTVYETLWPEFLMGWDLVLAVVPLLLAWQLFHVRRTRSPLWWLGVVLFVLFLPNAPYVLTDVIHFVDTVRREPPVPGWMITRLVIPQYVLFMFTGLQSYVISLLLVGAYLERQGRGAWVPRVELVLHALCSVGIYAGRFLRFNSWDVFEKPARVVGTTAEAFVDPGALVLLGVTFVILAGLYPVLKFVDVAVFEHWQRKYAVSGWLSRQRPHPVQS